MRHQRKYVARRIKLTDSLLGLVIQGKKTSTIRYGTVFIAHEHVPLVSDKRIVTVKVTRVEHSKTYGELDDNDARRDGFHSVSELSARLERFYPNILPSDPVTIIHFTKVD